MWLSIYSLNNRIGHKKNLLYMIRLQIHMNSVEKLYYGHTIPETS